MNESGDESGERLGYSPRNPFASPLSFTKWEVNVEVVGDPTGLVPVVKEVEWGWVQYPTSTLASTGARPVGGSQVVNKPTTRDRAKTSG